MREGTFEAIYSVHKEDFRGSYECIYRDFCSHEGLGSFTINVRRTFRFLGSPPFPAHEVNRPKLLESEETSGRRTLTSECQCGRQCGVWWWFWIRLYRYALDFWLDLSLMVHISFCPCKLCMQRVTWNQCKSSE